MPFVLCCCRSASACCALSYRCRIIRRGTQQTQRACGRAGVCCGGSGGGQSCGSADAATCPRAATASPSPPALQLRPCSPRHQLAEVPPSQHPALDRRMPRRGIAPLRAGSKERRDSSSGLCAPRRHHPRSAAPGAMGAQQDAAAAQRQRRFSHPGRHRRGFGAFRLAAPLCRAPARCCSCVRACVLRVRAGDASALAAAERREQHAALLLGFASLAVRRRRAAAAAGRSTPSGPTVPSAQHPRGAPACSRQSVPVPRPLPLQRRPRGGDEALAQPSWPVPHCRCRGAASQACSALGGGPAATRRR
jgi:hypothetical protein